jgi:hypothetical protein
MHHPLSPGHGEMRESSLDAAIILRECSFKLHAPPPDLRDYRMLMRQQAFKWRHSSIIYR